MNLFGTVILYRYLFNEDLKVWSDVFIAVKYLKTL
jgi:hypothetical protein